MISFVALYRGDSVASARLVAVSSDDEIVRRTVEMLELRADAESDPALGALRNGRREALRIIRDDEGSRE